MGYIFLKIRKPGEEAVGERGAHFEGSALKNPVCCLSLSSHCVHIVFKVTTKIIKAGSCSLAYLLHFAS